MSEQFYLAYRDLSEKDLSDSKSKKGFEVLKPQPGAQILRAGVFPGMFGFPDLHITHLNIDAEGNIEGKPASYKMLIITYTNHELTEDERQQIAMNGFAHLVSLGAIKPNTGAQQ
jgi:hypothetical protein